MHRAELLAELERLAVEVAACRERLAALGDALGEWRRRLAREARPSGSPPHDATAEPPPA